MTRWFCLASAICFVAAGCKSSPEATPPKPRPTAAKPMDTDAAFKQMAVDICKHLAAKANTDEKWRVAVYYFYALPGHRRNAVGEYVASLLPSFLAEVGGDKLTICTRRYLALVLKQQGEQLSAMYDETKQVELGKLIGARYIVCGNLSIFQDHYELAAEVVDLKTGEDIAQARAKLPRMKDLEDIAKGGVIGDVDADAPCDPTADGSPAAKLIEKADHYYDQRRDDKALDVYLKAEQVDSRSPRVLFRLGYLFQQLKHDPDRALGYYDRYIKLDPKTDANYHKAFNNRGVIYMDKADSVKAMADLDRAIAANPKYADAFSNRARCRTRLLKTDLGKALEDYEKAVELAPKSADFRFNLGVLLERLKRFDAALEAYTKAVELDPKHKLALCARGGLYYQPMGKPELAEADFTAALAIDPKLERALYRRGIVRAFGLHKTAAGAADLRTCLELQPNSPHAATIRKILDSINP